MALPYDELGDLTTDPNFRKRVKVAMLIYCDVMLIEPDNTTGHVSRARWAVQAKQNPDMYASQLQGGIVMDPGIKDVGNDATDAQVQAATEAEINKSV